MTSQHMDKLADWPWPDGDVPVDLRPYVLREWTEHRGDSPITLARPRKRRGAAVPPPAYLLKKAASAIGERAYYLLARFLDLPSAIVSWADYRAFPVAAIRFEPAAWRPDKLDARSGIAQAGDRVERLLNPLDEYRHLALYQVLDEIDDTEFMVRDRILFRIDAASVGDALWRTVVRALCAAVPDGPPLDSQISSRNSVVWGDGGLRARRPHGHAVYMETLEHLARHPEWDEVVAHDLRTCPAQSWRIDVRKLPPLDGLYPAQKAQVQAWFEVPVMEHVADAYLHTMVVQRAAIQRILSDGRGREDCQ
jgi:hypothetical protein